MEDNLTELLFNIIEYEEQIPKYLEVGIAKSITPSETMKLDTKYKKAIRKQWKSLKNRVETPIKMNK